MDFRFYVKLQIDPTLSDIEASVAFSEKLKELVNDPKFGCLIGSVTRDSNGLIMNMSLNLVIG